jgi:hypothetical protein
VALGWPLRGPWVAQGWPKPNPNPESAEGRSLNMPRGPKIAAHPTVIVSERRSRESNDPEQAKPH